MLYFSEIKSTKVTTEDGVTVGYLKDLIFLAADQPRVTKIVVRTDKNQTLIIPMIFVNHINSNFTLSKKYEIAELEENELFVRKNLLDKQIIDIKGNKIVRVNDVAIQDNPYLYIAGVDIGILGVLRQLGVEGFVTRFFGRIGYKMTSRFLSWGDIQPIELARGKVVLKKEEQKLAMMHPEDLAGYLEKTNISNVNKVLKILNEEHAAQVVGNLNINYQAALFRSYRPDKAAKLLTYIDPDEVVDVLLTLTPFKRRQIMDYFPAKKKDQVNHLLKFSDSPIGKLLTIEYLTVSADDTIREIIFKIKAETTDFALLNTVYVVNQEKQLTGVFNLHEMLLQNIDTPVYKFMIQNVSVVHLTTPVEIALNKMLKFKLQALPVIDERKQVAGLVTLVDMIEAVHKK